VPHSHALKALRRHHMIHHHAQHDARFGVTTPFWDWVFRTLPPAPGRGRNSAMRGGREHLSP
jgi:sterol desaturase/sphingolipid hydroxylase (fatty acid hydroxylase superfamily)